MTPGPITVYVVEDEPSVRQGLARLIGSAGMRAEGFATVSAMLEHAPFAERACVVADIRLPKTGGLELPALLAKRGRPLPVIFITAYPTDEIRAAAKQAGAAALFRKPVDGDALLDAITWAIQASDAPPTS